MTALWRRQNFQNLNNCRSLEERGLMTQAGLQAMPEACN